MEPADHGMAKQCGCLRVLGTADCRVMIVTKQMSIYGRLLVESNSCLSLDTLLVESNSP